MTANIGAGKLGMMSSLIRRWKKEYHASLTFLYPKKIPKVESVISVVEKNTNLGKKI